ncbi:MAG: DUF1549 and DUF1553 domain-containing protein [Gemmataceae bacterium]
MRRLLPIFCLTLLATKAVPADPAPAGVKVSILEGMADKRAWEVDAAKVTETYSEPAFGFVATPRRFNERGVLTDRSSPFLLRAEGALDVPAGEYRLLLRSLNAARLFVDDKKLTETEFSRPPAGGSHEHVPDLPASKEKGLRPLPLGHKEKIVTLKLAGRHRFRVEAVVGGQKLRPEVGELCLAIAKGKESFKILGSEIPLSDAGWQAYATARGRFHHERDEAARAKAQVDEQRYWASRHELARKEITGRESIKLPETKLPVHNAIDRFIGVRLEAARAEPAPLTDDHAFLRRVTLDTIGLLPTRAEIEAFVKDASPEKRAKVIDRLLADPRWADHWVSYWQDVLAENPGILKPTLNNTGPFRWWLHQAMLDNYPIDRFATELVRMEGSVLGGGPGGFRLATENDAPMAAKAHILGTAFLGVQLQCARCHDAPHHPFKQEATFSLAAMLLRGTQTVPKTSSVPAEVGGRKPRVDVTLKPGTKVPPRWPFAELAPANLPDGILRDKKDSREELAALITSPRNDRFAQVMVNRLWQRFLGAGIVEPVDDWHAAEASHPELLDWLARELVTHDYDMKYVARLILVSHAYQRQSRAGNDSRVAAERLFAGPARRRMTAEQLVDSAFGAAGKKFDSELLCLDPECRQRADQMLNLGRPTRAWQFTGLSNDRDRPALSLPVAQSIIDLLIAFGWRDSRQNPLTVRDETSTPLQPLLLANGLVGSRITRLSDDSAFTALCLEDRSVESMVRAVFLELLSRPSTKEETQLFSALLEEGFKNRRVPDAPIQVKPPRLTAVSWSNHLSPEATKIKLELERLARAGDPPTKRLQPEWRERMEDMIWTLLNSPEFVFVP